MENLPLVIAVGLLLSLGILAVGIAWRMLSEAKPFLDKKRKSITILDVKELSHDTKRFRLSLGSKNTPLGLPIGKHMKVFAPNPPDALAKGTWNGKPDPEAGKTEIFRTYTPTPSTKTCGYVDLVIKIYRPGKFRMPDGREIEWEDGGKVSCFLDRKKVGDTIEISGPVGVHEYLGRGSFKVPGSIITSKRFGLLAGGAGITPMLQLVYSALHDPKDTCTFAMIYANKTEEDILCRDIIDELESTSKGRFKVYYTLDFPPQGWQHKRGFITADMIKECLPAPEVEPIIAMCGPPPMVEFACKKNLDALGYAKTLQVAL
jgi:cytochrome-b5 reductase